MESVGRDAKEALKEVKKKQLELLYIAQGGQIANTSNAPRINHATSEPARARKLIEAAINEYLEDCRDRQGKSDYGLGVRTPETYSDRISYLIKFKPDAYLDQVDVAFVWQFRRFLRNHPKDFSDRTCYNIMQRHRRWALPPLRGGASPLRRKASGA